MRSKGFACLAAVAGLAVVTSATRVDAREHVALPSVNLGTSSFMGAIGGPGLLVRQAVGVYEAQRLVGSNGADTPGSHSVFSARGALGDSAHPKPPSVVDPAHGLRLAGPRSAASSVRGLRPVRAGIARDARADGGRHRLAHAGDDGARFVGAHRACSRRLEADGVGVRCDHGGGIRPRDPPTAGRPAGTSPALVTGAGLWTVAFVLYLVAYVPVLVTPRVDGKPG
jgi:hypothetical protein